MVDKSTIKYYMESYFVQILLSNGTFTLVR